MSQETKEDTAVPLPTAAREIHTLQMNSHNQQRKGGTVQKGQQVSTHKQTQISIMYIGVHQYSLHIKGMR